MLDQLPTRAMPHKIIGSAFPEGAEPASAAEALTLGKLDWTVELAPAFGALAMPLGVGADGELLTEMRPVADSRHRAVIRRESPNGPTVLGMAGLRYEPLQNAEAFAFLDDMLQAEGRARIIGAGALDGGRRTFAFIELPRHIELRDGDKINTYLLAENRHDGNGSFRLAAMGNRPYCTNQIRATLRGARLSFNARHTSSITARAEEARQALGLVDRYAEALEAAAGTLLEMELSDSDLTSWADELLPEPPAATERQRATVADNRGELLAIARSSATCESGRGTAWAAWNAATEWDQHYRGRSRNELRIAERAMTADSDGFATRALQLLAPALAG